MTETMTGYNGKIAYIDLTEKKVEIKPLDPEIAEDYIGGTGLSAKLIFDLLSEEDYRKLKKNPFDSVNPIVFATGPVTGTPRPASGRYSVSAISPLTNQWGEGTSGGFFCINLRKSGYDALVITGKSEKPCYILIEKGEIKFKDATNLWGKGTYETQEVIKKQNKIKGLRIDCIGPAAENLVRYACIMNDEGRAQGRCGLGAILGSKKLKAIAIERHSKITGQDNKAMIELRKKIDDEKEDLSKLLPQMQYLYGTNLYMDMGMFAGDVPAYYFTEAEFPAEILTEKTIKEHLPVFSSGCAGCTIKCAKHTVIVHDSKEIVTDGPEFETVASFGSSCGLFDREKVSLAGHLANIYGFDTISGGVSIAFLIYLVKEKISLDAIKKSLKDIKLEEIDWGNGDLICKLIKKIALREGIGNVIAEGVKRMAEKWGVDPELAAHVKGLEVPMHDPRAYAGQALSYMTACCGANHEKGDWFQTEIFGFEAPEWDIINGDNHDITGREKGVMHLQDLRGIDDSAVVCNFHQPSKVSEIAKYVSLSSGFDYTPRKLMLAGERIFNLKRVISCKMGITQEDDRLPKHVLEVMKSGKTAGLKLEMKGHLKEYYKHRGWDWKTGHPTEEKLKELGIIGEGEEVVTDVKLEVTKEEKAEIKKLKALYVPKLKAKQVLWEDVFPYLDFIILLANNEVDFFTEFEVADERILFAVSDLPEKEWSWIRIKHGEFSVGRGMIENPTLRLDFKDKSFLMRLLNQDVNIRRAVLTGRIKVKPLGKARVIANFFGLYMNKIGMKLEF
ncbi:MAG: aldehyde ferredoxin oxidoreductase family protein [Asgard group archaeon]|nr:aldehyde ferredoxin oxidoreductase family protein [Asgard group archaeon]